MKIAPFLGLSDEAEEIVEAAEKAVLPSFAEIDAIAQYNQAKVLSAFQACQIQPAHFAPSTGYGYDDRARDTLDQLFAKAFGCEKALVRPQIVSGTHALSICLFGLLGQGKTLCYVSGKPYDTLEKVIGLSPAKGSLLDRGCLYRQVDLLPDGSLDLAAICALLEEDASIGVVAVQRSAGYAWRRGLSLSDMAGLYQKVHSLRKDVFVMVDNGYGEFCQTEEPVAVGADLMAGSLIKNPGGGLAPTGGYIAGTERALQRVEEALTAPGIGSACGSYEATYRPYYQGFFQAPAVTASAQKTALLFAQAFSSLQYAVHPGPQQPRTDIIQAIAFGAPGPLLAFCKAIQAASPVDAMATPEPWDMPGYTHPVVMAAGTFVQGASIELSADAPMLEPYICYFQGGLTYEHGRIGCLYAVDSVLKAKKTP